MNWAATIATPAFGRLAMTEKRGILGNLNYYIILTRGLQ